MLYCKPKTTCLSSYIRPHEYRKITCLSSYMQPHEYRKTKNSDECVHKLTIWVLSTNRKLNNRINNIHKRALRIVFQYKNTSFDELLKKAGTVNIYYENLQILATEMYKAYHNHSPIIMSDIFPRRPIQYNLHHSRIIMSDIFPRRLYSTIYIILASL